MPNPVVIPPGPLSISPEVNAKAEQLLSAIVQVINSGATGEGVSPTHPTITPTERLGEYKALALATGVQQQAHRQLSVAIASVLPSWVGSTYNAVNVGTNGEGVYKGQANNTFQFHKLLPGSNVSIEKTDADEIRISALVPKVPEISIQNVGTSGVGLFKDRVNDTFRFYKILQGVGVTIQHTSSDEILISSPGSGTFDGVHNDLEGRSDSDAHPIHSITDLPQALDKKADNLWVEGEFVKRDRLWFFKATAPLELEIGTLVYVSGPRAVAAADPSMRQTMPAVGIIVRRDETGATVQVAGIVEDIYKNLSPGQMYFTDYNGRLSSTPPVPLESGFAYFQAVGVALDETTLDFSPSMNMTRRG